MWNHLTATIATPDRTDRLSEVAVPTLVLHGSEDHVIPPVHATATADLIPSARLVVVDGLGHQFDADGLALVVDPLLEHLTSAR